MYVPATEAGYTSAAPGKNTIECRETYCSNNFKKKTIKSKILCKMK